MNAPNDIHGLVSDLKSKGEAFAVATVVRTIAVTSAKAGAKAIIMRDGTISEGWIGGGCARAAVLKAARETIETGVPVLVSLQPEDVLDEKGVVPGDIKDGVKFSTNMCPSQGSMDIFVEPIRPFPELVIFGASPVAIALSMLARPMGFSVIVCCSQDEHQKYSHVDQLIDGFELPKSNARRFVIVSTQGTGDARALKSALESKADYVAFVGSRKKAESLKNKLKADGIDEEKLANIKAPAGLDIKAITPEEIALSILAEIVQKRRTEEVVSNSAVDQLQ